jgi:mannose-6-phosphate isomerase
MQLELKSTERYDIFQEVSEYLTSLKIKVVSQDFNRPWGGFFVIDEDQAQQFADLFFPGIELSSLRISGKLSPKILVVEPGKRLSWQYHNRRAEIWRSLSNNVGVITSMTDDEDEVKTLKAGDEIRLAQGQRHRIVGLSSWGVLAEIWQHTDTNMPSDEDDIIRVQDDFGR